MNRIISFKSVISSFLIIWNFHTKDVVYHHVNSWVLGVDEDFSGWNSYGSQSVNWSVIVSGLDSRWCFFKLNKWQNCHSGFVTNIIMYNTSEFHIRRMWNERVSSSYRAPYLSQNFCDVAKWERDERPRLFKFWEKEREREREKREIFSSKKNSKYLQTNKNNFQEYYLLLIKSRLYILVRRERERDRSVKRKKKKTTTTTKERDEWERFEA